MTTSKDDDLLTAAAEVIGWDDPDARRRLLAAIRDEPACTDPTCCPRKDKQPMFSIDTWLKIGKAAVWIYVIAAVAALAFAMVYGEDLS